MAVLPKPPVFKRFTLALIQLGNIGVDKSTNLRHAHEMIVKAAMGKDKKPDLIVLPVRPLSSLMYSIKPTNNHRNASTHPMVMSTSPYMQKTLHTQESIMTSQRARARVSRCCLLLLKKLVCGLSEVNSNKQVWRMQHLLPVAFNRFHTWTWRDDQQCLQYLYCLQSKRYAWLDFTSVYDSLSR